MRWYCKINITNEIPGINWNGLWTEMSNASSSWAWHHMLATIRHLINHTQWIQILESNFRLGDSIFDVTRLKQLKVLTEFSTMSYSQLQHNISLFSFFIRCNFALWGYFVLTFLVLIICLFSICKIMSYWQQLINAFSWEKDNTL